VLVTDAAAGSILGVEPDGTRVTVDTGLADPTGIAVDAAGDIAVAETGADRVDVIAPDGTSRQLGGQLVHARGVAYLPDGTLAVLQDTGVVELSPAGTATPVPLPVAIPNNIASDAAGDLFVSGRGASDGIVELAADGTERAVSTVLANGLAADAAGDVFYPAATVNGQTLHEIAADGTDSVVNSTGDQDQVVGLAVDQAGALIYTVPSAGRVGEAVGSAVEAYGIDGLVAPSEVAVVPGAPAAAASPFGHLALERADDGNTSTVIGPADGLALTAGTGVTYLVQAFDSAGRSQGVLTPANPYDAEPDGSCSYVVTFGTTCTIYLIGTHTISASAEGLVATATEEITPAAAVSAQLAPGAASTLTGVPQAFSVTSKDRYGNTVADVTASSTLQIDADGSCDQTAHTCTGFSPGSHAVTATVTGLGATTNFAQLATQASVSASNMSVNIVAGQPFTQAAPGALAGSSGPPGDTLTARLVSNATNGSVALNADGSYVYTANPGYTGFDQFSYEAVDSVTGAESAVAYVSLTSSAVPTASPASYQATDVVGLSQAAPGLIGLTTAPNHDQVVITVQQPANGTVTVQPSGAWTYAPHSGYQGVDTFTYTATDQTTHLVSSSATISVTVSKSPQTLVYNAGIGGAVGQDAAPIGLVAGNSEEPIVLTVDPASAPGVCTASGNTVDFLAVGNCVLDANEAGDANYLPAPQLVFTVPVTLGDTVTPFAQPAAGTTFVADYGTGDIDEVLPDGSQHVVVALDDHVATRVSVMANGDLLVPDTGHNRVLDIAPSGTQRVIGAGYVLPFDAVSDSHGNVFVADTYNDRVVEVLANGTQKTLVPNVFSFGVAVDGAGDLFYADDTNQRIVEIATDGTTRTVAQLSANPTDVAVDAAGDVYAALAGSGSVVEYRTDGTQRSVATGLAQPFGIAVDGAGDVLVAGDTTAVRVAPDGTITTVGSGWTQPYGIAVASGAAAGPQTVTFGSLPAPTFGAAPVTVSATSTSGLPVTIVASGACSGTGTSPLSVTVTGAGTCSLAAAQAGNTSYTAASASSSFTVAPKAITATVTGSQFYGGAGRTFTAAYTGLVGTETPTGTVTCTVGTTIANTTAPGSYPTALSACKGTSSPDYTITFTSGTFTIAKAPLTVTAISASRSYGATNPNIGRTYAGLVNGQTAPPLSALINCTTTAAVASPVGSYPTTCSSGVSADYTISYVAGTLTVTPVTLTAEINGTQTYGGAGISYSVFYVLGLVNGQTSALVKGTPVCSTTVGPRTAIGTYNGTISGCSGLTAPNYTVTYGGGSFLVTRAMVTVTASNITMTYGSAAPPVTPSYAGLVNGDTPAVFTHATTCNAAAGSGSNVGTYATNCAATTAANYLFTYVAGKATVVVAQVALTYTGANTVASGAALALPVKFVSTAALCQIGGTVQGTLDRNPSTAAAGPYALPSGAVGTSGWKAGVYLLTFSSASTNANCLSPSPITTALTVTTTTGLLASAGGTVTIPGQATPVAFGMTAASATNAQFTLVQNGFWRFVASSVTYTKTGTGAATVAGTGTLSWWNATTGAWQVASTTVPFTAALHTGSPATIVLGLTFIPAAGQPTTLPVTAAAQPLASGTVTIA
jgi:sugar lactone lactonase YvrE